MIIPHLAVGRVRFVVVAVGKASWSGREIWQAVVSQPRLRQRKRAILNVCFSGPPT